MNLEKRFEQAIFNSYTRARKEVGYNASRFIQMVAEKGGLQVAKQLLHSNTISQGFSTLIENNRYDLTVEYMILLPEFSSLFTEEEKVFAREKLLNVNVSESLLPKNPTNHEEFHLSLKFPPLKPKTRDREFNTYQTELKYRVIYEYLFSLFTHRQLDESILGLNSKQSKGYQAMGILHYIGLRNEHKGIFKDLTVEEAIEILKKNTVNSSILIF